MGLYKHHNNTIRLTIQYKAALTTCVHKYKWARLYIVLLEVLYCYDVCTPLHTVRQGIFNFISYNIFYDITAAKKEVLALPASLAPCDSEIVYTLLKTYVKKSDLQ